MKLAVLVLCVMGLYCVSMACRCALPSKTQLYCESDFVFKVNVTSSLINENGQQDFDDYYKIEILIIYKNKKSDSVKILPLGNKYPRLYTGTNSAMCGIYLETGNEYIVSGTVRNGRRNINYCSSWIESPITDASLSLINRLKTRPFLCYLKKIV